jgi:hypothetical protein
MLDWGEQTQKILNKHFNPHLLCTPHCGVLHHFSSIIFYTQLATISERDVWIVEQCERVLGTAVWSKIIITVPPMSE